MHQHGLHQHSLHQHSLHQHRLRQILAVGSCLLVFGSWRLWTPHSVFPRVPLWSGIADWPGIYDQAVTWGVLSLWLVVTGLLALVPLRQAGERVAALVYAISFTLLVVLDQHRLQPWGVHIAVSLLICAFAAPMRRAELLTLFTASIYFYSAISKFDAQFLYTVGQDFLAACMRFLGQDLQAWPLRGRFWLASLFPFGELLCGLGLLWSRLRWWAWPAAIVMHLTLLAILGPWGLNHSWGVLLWNGLFVVINGRLMFEARQARAASSRLPSANVADKIDIADRVDIADRIDIADRADATGSRMVVAPKLGLAELLVGLAFCLPLGERLGWVDHWLGWALYAPHSSRAQVELVASAVSRQPKIVQRFIDQTDDQQLPWYELAIDRWSLETLGVPVYPQQRFYVAVARAVASELDEFEVQVTLLEAANRWTGRRSQRRLETRRELDQLAEDYWFSTQPIWRHPAIDLHVN